MADFFDREISDRALMKTVSRGLWDIVTRAGGQRVDTDGRGATITSCDGVKTRIDVGLFRRWDDDLRATLLAAAAAEWAGDDWSEVISVSGEWSGA